MTTKRIYPTNKIIVKDPNEIKNYDYINPSAQQIFNFILAEMIKNKSNIIELKISDFFCWLNKKHPQGNEYRNFKKQIEILKKSFIIVEKNENQKIKRYEWPLIAQTETTFNSYLKTEKIEIALNPYLCKYYLWQRANVPIDINITRNLNVKYAYKLFEFLSYYFRKNSKPNYVSINELRRILTAPSAESNSRFLSYVERAIININDNTPYKIQAKVKTKNQKALASSEIKFINNAEKIAEIQAEVLRYELYNKRR